MSTQVKTNGKEHYIYSIVAVLTTTFLCFIDEGAYNFEWAKEPGNWFAFSIYATGIFLGQLFVSKVFFRKLDGLERVSLAVLIGTILGIAAIISMFLFIMK